VTGKIWYVTLTERLTSTADFRKCAEQTISVARDVFANDTSIAQKVAEAWVSVGIIDAVPAELSRAVTAAAILAVGLAMAVPAIDQAIAGLGQAETGGPAAAAAVSTEYRLKVRLGGVVTRRLRAPWASGTAGLTSEQGALSNG
jgi:Thermolysin metallopeptidase, alpha-helical domain